MEKKIIIYDASLLVDAYETQLFRTGLFRVCSELLKRLIESRRYEIWLYDVVGRERLLRQYIMPIWPGVEVLGGDSLGYRKIAYPLLRLADKCCEKQKGMFSLGFKILKTICITITKCLHWILRDHPLPIPIGSQHYISTYYPVPFWVHKNGLCATLIIHDLIPLIHPEWFPNEANKHLLNKIIHSVDDADSVICVSDSTRKDFLKFRTDFPCNHVFVAHLAGADYFRPQALNTELQQRYNISGNDYFLSVCTLEPRKNLFHVIETYEMLLKAKNGVAPKLLLVGAIGWKTDSLIDKINRINENYTHSIVMTGYLCDNDLAQLYSNSLAFIYVSLYEGFGLPPLEAMQCGAPVIVSDVSSLPEVVGNVGIKVPTNDKLQLLSEMLKVLESDQLSLNKIKEQSLRQAALFSWSSFAQIIMKTL